MESRKVLGCVCAMMILHPPVAYSVFFDYMTFYNGNVNEKKCAFGVLLALLITRGDDSSVVGVAARDF
jgi:hypothetical protein